MSLLTSPLQASPWLRTAQVSLSNIMTYKFNFIALVFLPPLVFLALRYNIWSTVLKNGNQTTAAGYDHQAMMAYQAWVFVLTIFVQGFVGNKIAEDIHKGKISAFLLYPFSFWQFHTATFLATLALQAVVAVIAISVFIGANIIVLPASPVLLVGLALTCAGAWIWYLFQYIIALSAFWLGEVWVVRSSLYLMCALASGSILPLEFFPANIIRILGWTPFPYLIYVPIRVLTGAPHDDLVLTTLIFVGWGLALTVLTNLVWRRGIRMYTGGGI